MKLSEDQQSALNDARLKLQKALRLVDALFDDDSFDEDDLDADIREAIDKCEAAVESLQEARIQ